MWKLSRLVTIWPGTEPLLAVLPKGKNKQQEPKYPGKIKPEVIPFFTLYVPSHSPTGQDGVGARPFLQEPGELLMFLKHV